jgi:uncharacterized ferritin-like protein (DUF455 family)
MELREFAERIVFATTLEEKLWCPEGITDERPGEAVSAPRTPGRPHRLEFKTKGSAGNDFPGMHRLDQPRERGRLLHFFANHELLATELMALVLLRFPAAPAAFRKGVLRTLRDEQVHTRLYLQRMAECGIEFGELPVSGYFWRCVAGMEHPIDYVAGLSLTFEQANLDFCRQFSAGFAKVGDAETASLLGRIYRDEIGHVAYGLKWFRKWKNPELSDWEAFCRHLKFPLSPQRAKGAVLNAEGRREAGLDPEFISELRVYAKSKGRTPVVYVFNPFAEGRIAFGKSFTPLKHQANLATDLANLPQFLCRQDDIVLVPRRPTLEFLTQTKAAGFSLPEFVEISTAEITEGSGLANRKLSGLRPWAWGPDSVELFGPLFPNLPESHRPACRSYNQAIGELYSKAWSVGFLRRILESRAREPWLCTAGELGTAVNTMGEALLVIKQIRSAGHLKLVAKQGHGLAGHNSLRLWETEISLSQQRWMERSLVAGRQLVIEPWLEREVDFSIQLEMSVEGLKVCGYTGLLNDLRGQFRANWAEPNHSRSWPSLALKSVLGTYGCADGLRQLHEEIFEALAGEFQRVGYQGPVGIDAFIYRSAQGQLHLKPVVEINPRYTMGRLTLELMNRVLPGRCGVFQLTNLSQVQAQGYETFRDYAEACRRRAPLILGGMPVPKIDQGLVFLNDAVSAKACVATFQVGRNIRNLLPG